MGLLVLCIAALGLCAAIALWPRWQARRRDQIRAQTFPAAWRKVLRRRAPLVARLPPALQLELKRLIQVFLAEKTFVGCGGLIVTDEMRVTVAAHACLLMLGRRQDHFPQLREILMYPDAFATQSWQQVDGGVLQEERRVMTGESWAEGRVILSWQDVLEGAADSRDGYNVVIHEFAHQLDQEKGFANGAPTLGSKAAYARWSGVMAAEFEALQHHAEQGLPCLIDVYGASSPAEFFSVASETFFEAGAEMAQVHPALYGLLRDYYGVNPAEWH